MRAGYIASVNMGGVAIGSVVCAALSRKWSWQTLIRAGAAIMIGCNILTMSAASLPSVAALRLIAGLGEGVIGAICYAAMAQSHQPARALAFYIAGQGLIGAIGMGTIPILVAPDRMAVFLHFVSIIALPAFLARASDRDPACGAGTVPDNARQCGSPWSSVYALAGVLVFYLGMSSVWAFVERMGHASGIDAPRTCRSRSHGLLIRQHGGLSAASRSSPIGCRPSPDLHWDCARIWVVS